MYQAFVTSPNLSTVPRSYLALLLCGITASVLTAASCAALFGRRLYRRLNTRGAFDSMKQAQAVRRFQKSIFPWTGVKYVYWDINEEEDVQVQDPIAICNDYDDVNLGYSEVDEEGLGVHFVDFDLEGGRSMDRRSC
ncbi:MAG: hypothetical protein Q9219_001609 [cf. Caloplaca sp. 3 TL-2023]